LKPAIRGPGRPVVAPKPTASATIEPIGPRVGGTRCCAVRLVLRFTDADPKFTNRRWMTELAGNALAALSAATEHEAPTFGDVLAKDGGSALGLEAHAVYAAKPPSVDPLRQVLRAAGYEVDAREVRECGEPGCSTSAVVESARAAEVPAGWFGAEVCGRHGYKLCPACSSTYAMSCSNANNSAPSVHCEVCGGILVEWGGTKLWTADLVKRAAWPTV
jgi:hypothetical protein